MGELRNMFGPDASADLAERVATTREKARYVFDRSICDGGQAVLVEYDYDLQRFFFQRSDRLSMSGDTWRFSGTMNGKRWRVVVKKPQNKAPPPTSAASKWHVPSLAEDDRGE